MTSKQEAAKPVVMKIFRFSEQLNEQLLDYAQRRRISQNQAVHELLARAFDDKRPGEAA